MIYVFNVYSINMDKIDKWVRTSNYGLRIGESCYMQDNLGHFVIIRLESIL